MSNHPLPVEQITISGATLASILHRFSSAAGDVDGLLFGHLTPLPPPDPNDDIPSSSATTTTTSAATLPLFSAAITGHFSSNSPASFYDPTGRIDPQSLRRASAADRLPFLLGWFSGRRSTPLRPSMREIAVSNSLSQTLTLNSTPKPCIFLLLSSSSTENGAVHTHEYRAFRLRRRMEGGAGLLEPRSLNVVNIGPDFRGRYGSFLPDSVFPLMALRAEDKVAEESGAAQVLLDSVCEGFAVERLEKLVGPGVEEYGLGLEDLYRRMLLKLEGLARLVERSDTRVVEQENKNLKMRCRLAGLE